MRSLNLLQVNPVPSIAAEILTMEIRCTVSLEVANVERMRVEWWGVDVVPRSVATEPGEV